MTADERRDALLEIIFARRYETIENLAFEFAVCRRTRRVASFSAFSDLYDKRNRRRCPRNGRL